MDTKVAVISIILENGDYAEKINNLLHNYRQYIIGRMGLPYHAKKVNIISIALDAPQDVISALAGKLGNVSETSVKTSIIKA